MSSVKRLTIPLLYDSCVGIVFSCRIERCCYEVLAFRVLTANQHPDHIRNSEFRRCNLHAIKGVCLDPAPLSEGRDGETDTCGLGWHQGAG